MSESRHRGTEAGSPAAARGGRRLDSVLLLNNFSIDGLGVGGMGIQTLDAVGAVYGLTDLSQFSGLYAEMRAGVTVGLGKGYYSLENGNGVTMDLKFSGDRVPEMLAVAKRQARTARLRANRESSCSQCWPASTIIVENPAAA